MTFRFSILPAILFSFLLVEGNAQDISKDQKMGAKYSEQIEASMGIYDNPKMTKYIAEIGERLVSQLDSALFDFQFKLIATTVPNAFALPGGYLYITTGLIPLLETEDELACIMAHEIIHANNRHSVRSMKKNVLPNILQIPGNIVGIFNQTAGQVVNAPIRAISTVGHASYSRKQETEADTEGIALAAKAGYDPNALKDILSRLAQQVELTTGKAEEKSFLSDHPFTPDRVRKVDELLKTINYTEAKSISNNFLKEFDGIIAGDDPDKGIVIGQQFIQPTANFSITMPDEWEVNYRGNTVAGNQKDDDAGLYCRYDTSSQSPEEASTDFLKKLSPKYQKFILGSESISINGTPGYMISFSEKNEEKETYGFRIWMKSDTMLYEIYAIGYTPFRETLEEIVYTIKPLTETDKKEVMVAKLKVVKAEEGETLEALSKRTDNTMSLELSAIINAHKQDVPFAKGDEVKIVVNSPYYN